MGKLICRIHLKVIAERYCLKWLINCLAWNIFYAYCWIPRSLVSHNQLNYKNIYRYMICRLNMIPRSDGVIGTQMHRKLYSHMWTYHIRPTLNVVITLYIVITCWHVQRQKHPGSWAIDEPKLPSVESLNPLFKMDSYECKHSSIKRNHHASVVWNLYHWFAIAHSYQN